MNLLLLADIPPCSNYTGGWVIAEQCRLLPPGSLCAFIVLNPQLQPLLSPDLSDMPMRIVDKPNEHGEWERGPEGAIAAENFKATVRRDELVAHAVAFGREQKVTAVWAMLEGQTIVRMALSVAETLGVPLYSQVWDPLSWWLREHKVDSENATAALEQFDATLRGSRACAAASWNMAEQYEKLYGTRSVAMISGYDSDAARTPPLELRRPDEVVIGMAGQFYADDAWDRLIGGLDAENWRIRGRSVRIFYLGGDPGRLPPQHCTHGGYLSPPEAIDALALHADILYCPYPFRAEMAEVARLSFPSKLVMYAAAGRPIFCHAPYYASPAQYLDRNGAGAVCSSLDGRAVYEMLRWIVGDPAVYARLAGAAQQAFRTDFTRAVMARNFADFLS
jgi:glycosyltransferase involved in cell wall biosynthesis